MKLESLGYWNIDLIHIMAGKTAAKGVDANVPKVWAPFWATANY